jgi:hypothetical protein
MYLLRMEQRTKEDITAAVGAHQELGPHFDGAVAESLVDRIGDEIDRRVDARMGDRGRGRPARRQSALPPAVAHSQWPSVVLSLGSMGVGIGATAAVLSMSQDIAANGGISNPIDSGQIFLCVLIWVVIGVINVAHARRR